MIWHEAFGLCDLRAEKGGTCIVHVYYVDMYYSVIKTLL